MKKWVHNYNYHRTHQGIGGLLVPAERFHGQAEQILSNLSQTDNTTKPWIVHGKMEDEVYAAMKKYC